MLPSYFDVEQFFHDIPGLTVAHSKDSEIDLEVTYDDGKYPFCPYDEQRSVPNGYSVRSTPVIDRIDDHIIRVKYRQRRYKCPNCGAEMEYDTPYIKQGCKTTERMNSWIGETALYHSYDEVSQMTGGAVSKASVGRIAKAWAEKGIQNFILNLEAPPKLGIHIVGPTKKPYVLLTDLSGDILVDVVKAVDFFGYADADAHLLTALIRLNDQALVKHVCTAVDPVCLSPAKSVFPRAGVDTIVARASLYKFFADAVCDAVASNNRKPVSRVLLGLIATPLDQELTPIEQDKMKQLSSAFGNTEAMWIGSLLKLRKILLDAQFQEKEYLAWKSELKWMSQFRNLVKYLNYADREIRSGFGKDALQQCYENNTAIADEIVAKNNQCSFDILRARMLLTVEPETYRPKGADKDAIIGISMGRLYETMQRKLQVPVHAPHREQVSL